MKLILLEDIKNKGKELDIKDFANGYANFLIKEGKAVLATEENLAKRQKEIDRRLDLENDELHLAQRVFDDINNKTFVIKRVMTPKGTPSESVTKNDICELINNPAVDSKMLKTDVIKTFGLFDIKVKLHKNVEATIKVKVED